MSADAFPQDREICRIAQHIVSDSLAPAVSICVAKNRSDGWLLRHGSAGWLRVTDAIPVSPCTPFDLASVTKPFVALTTALLACTSAIQLSTPITNWIPEFGDSPHGSITIEQLLSHRAGLRPHLNLFASAQRAQAMNQTKALHELRRQGSLRTSRDVHPHVPLYSDLGYLLVGIILERAVGVPLDQLVGDMLCAKLKLRVASSRQWRLALPEFEQVVAPTEHVPWRGGMLRGVVHDENAWTLFGYGMAGHAGLFGTAASVAELGCAVVDSIAGTSLVLHPFAARFCTSRRAGGTLRAGFDGKSSLNSSAGSLLGAHAFGHLGFTGTSLWCDPERGLVIALLTNRVSPSRKNTRLVAARGFLHDCLVRAAHSPS
jgi:CubicO group peptidase (beta-lactamase class C family)